MSEINNTSVLDNTSPDWPRVDDLVQIVKGYLRVDWTGTETPADKDARGRIIADPRLWPLYQLVRPHQEDPNYLAKLVRDHIPEPENQQKFVTAWKLAHARALAQLEARDAAKDATRAAAAAKAEAKAKAAKRAETEAEKARKEAEARAVAETLDQVPLTQTYNPTDLGNAERFVNKFGAVLRYCHPWKKWLYWDGRRWSYDRIGIVGHCAKDTVRAIATEEADLVGDEARGLLRIWARKSEDAKSLCSLVKLATSESSLPILPETLDADPWLLNCRNCTLDLRRGAPSLTRPHHQADLITKLAPVTYDPDATCPHWESTMRLVFANNDPLIAYWQQLCGIALTGIVDEQILPILYGTGSNGKSTIINSMLGLLGPDYAMKAPPNFLMLRSHEAHPTELADLHGKRLVAAIETGEGARINEVLAKELTGKDPIRARRMREDFWEFLPTHKPWLATNHRPSIRGTDHAFWRRIREIPFTVAIPEQQAIKNMDRILMCEFSGILNWCIEGCRRWQQAGLITPEVVQDATEAYKAEQDILVQFFDSECVLASKERLAAEANKHISKIAIKISAKQLHSAFNRWIESNTSRGPMAPHLFSKAMIDHGYEPQTHDRTVWYVGINLRHEPTKEQPSASIDR